MSATNNTLNVYVGGQCNTTYNLPAYSPSLAHSQINFRGAITEALCMGPGCVIQERSAVSNSSATNSSSTSGDNGLSGDYQSRCTSSGGTYNLKTTRQGDDGATYRIAYCAVGAPEGVGRVGEAMEGLERTSVWCSNIPARLGGANRVIVTASLLLPGVGSLFAALLALIVSLRR